MTQTHSTHYLKWSAVVELCKDVCRNAEDLCWVPPPVQTGWWMQSVWCSTCQPGLIPTCRHIWHIYTHIIIIIKNNWFVPQTYNYNITSRHRRFVELVTQSYHNWSSIRNVLPNLNTLRDRQTYLHQVVINPWTLWTDHQRSPHWSDVQTCNPTQQIILRIEPSLSGRSTSDPLDSQAKHAYFVRYWCDSELNIRCWL